MSVSNGRNNKDNFFEIKKLQIENSGFVETCDEQAHTNSGDWSLTSSTLMLTVAELDFPPLSSAVIVWKEIKIEILFFFLVKTMGAFKSQKNSSPEDSNKWKFSHVCLENFVWFTALWALSGLVEGIWTCVSKLWIR